MTTQQQIKDAILNTVEGSFDFDYVDKDELIEQFTDDVYSVCNELAEAKEEQ